MLRSISKDLSATNLVLKCANYSRKLRKLNALVTDRYDIAERQAIVSQLRLLKGN